MIDPDVRLLAHNKGGAVIGQFTDIANEYSQEITEGPLQASFSLKDGEDSRNSSRLRSWFNNRMMWPISAEYENSMVWYGYIFDMELQIYNRIWKKSMDGMANTIIAEYQRRENDDGNTAIYTDWVVDEESVKLYGRREMVINVNTESVEEATARAEGMLKRLLNPHMSPPVLFNEEQEPILRVTAVGRHTLANGTILLRDKLRYHPDYVGTGEDGGDPQHGDATTVSAEIKRILDFIQYQSGWLYALEIEDNDTPTKMGVPSSVGAWERIAELALVPNSNGDQYELRVEDDGGVTYRKINKSRFFYYAFPYPAGVEKVDGQIPKWDARPGIIKIADPQIEPVILPSSWLDDPTLLYSDQVIMQDGRDAAEFYNRSVNSLEDYAAIDANKTYLESEG